MARKLKTFTTSAGFFDLAVAAPSMKAALEAWGSKNNLFQHGFAKVSEDPKIVAATMAHPGVVLRRPVGSNGAFSEHAELPTDLPVGKAKHAPAKRSAKRPEPPTKPVDDKTAREAARRSRRSRSGATASAAGKRPTGNENASAASGPSRQLKPLLSKPGTITRQESKTSKKTAPGSTKDRKRRMHAGERRRKNWRQNCAKRGLAVIYAWFDADARHRAGEINQAS